MEEQNNCKRKVFRIAVFLLVIIGIVIFCVLYIKMNRKYEYHINVNGTITIDKYLGHETDVVIPNEIGGKKVTELGVSCFEENESVINIHIPSSVKSIEAYAFARCSSLERITGGENVEVIYQGAFCSDKMLVDVFDLSNVEMIMNWAFDDSVILENVIVSDKLRYIGALAFDGTGVVPSIIPDSMQTIGTYAFSKIEKDDKKDAFLIVGDEMLIDYPNIETVEIPYGVKFVSVSKSGKKNVKKIIIPNTVTFVDSCILEKVENSVIYLPESVEKIGIYYNNEYIEKAFLDVSKIYGIEGSYAQEYAKRYGIEFEAVESWY